jgi:hypothetical protein
LRGLFTAFTVATLFGWAGYADDTQKADDIAGPAVRVALETDRGTKGSAQAAISANVVIDK